jgi:lipoprotein-anchoring transpeptidase ErfK/SrfK
MKTFLLILLTAVSEAAAGPRLDPSAINKAHYEAGEISKGPSPFLIKLQILLDRANISPGTIDGHMGNNLKIAIREFEAKSHQPADGIIDRDVWKLLDDGTEDVLVSYDITAEDAASPFVGSISEDFAEMARLDRLSYTSPAELLAEKFHMHIKLLRALNPGAHFDQKGEQIIVANVKGAMPKSIARLDVDIGKSVVRGFAQDESLVVAYPATVGSDENPSPSGRMKVKALVKNPKYFYRPKKNFQQGDNDQPLDIPPGPNGPVGSIWIDLSKEGYGIHGTAEPELIGKTSSHGCVRLTNWDAEELSELVHRGMPVTFVE